MSKPAPLSDLEQTVATMRALGVTEWNGIKLGAVPVPKASPPAEKERQEARKRKQERKRDTLFAASSLRPYIEEDDDK